jgi:N-hydroxyarylamine O-acetyltransferase
MNLEAYLRRIGFTGSPKPDLSTLKALQYAHINAIPFENLDVQLATPPDMNSEAMFDKLVVRGRGGWCYEMNGVFGWALQEIGFDVTRLAGGVMREQMGDRQIGNHLCLLVRLEQDYLADVGFGSALAQPIPLQPGEHDSAPFDVGISRVDDDYWRYSERAFGDPFSFDFRAEPADETLLAAKCEWQGAHPDSNFIANLVAQKRQGARHLTLRGKVLTEIGADGVKRTTLGSAEELVSVLKSDFNVDVPEAAALWPKICARHAELFGQG